MTTHQLKEPAINATVPETAMVLAAGLGTRMQPLTEHMPKVLVRVSGKTLIDHALDMLQRSGVKHAVVNVHHHADQVEAHLAGRKAPRITISDERAQLLDSGGGVSAAMPHIGEKPFFVINADSFWLDGFRPNLVNMAAQWDDEKMDVLLLLASLGVLIAAPGLATWLPYSAGFGR